MRPIDDDPKPDATLPSFPPLEITLAEINRSSVRALVNLRLERIDAAFSQGLLSHRILLQDSDAIAAYARRLTPEDSRKLYDLLDLETHAALADVRRYADGLLARADSSGNIRATAILQHYQLAIIALAWITAFVGCSLFFAMAYSLME